MADAEEETDVTPPRLSASDFDIFAEKLLTHQLLLTALELHTELVEAGLEIPRLRDFFSNPGNFERQYQTTTLSSGAHSPVIPRTSSIATIDSLDDYARYSDDGARDTDEKVAVLEFELRKAHETIKALRGSLTEATETETPASEGSHSENTERDHSTGGDLLRPHEKRALNFLVNEYLLKNGYRMTSVTFSDENADQDFDDWDDVGLNTAKPPDLLHLYRDYGHHTIPEVMLVLKSVKEEKANLEAEYTKLQEECKQLQEGIGELKYENHTLNETIEKLESEIKEIVNSSYPTERTLLSPGKSTDLSETDTDGVTAGPISDSTTENEDATDGNNYPVEINESGKVLNEDENADNAEKLDVSEELGDKDPEENFPESDSHQGNTADVELTQQKGDVSQVRPLSPSSQPGSIEEKDQTSSRYSG